jgi:CHAT domain-containing protein/tetratricopeptide (TPR) repeat protein
VLASPPLAWLAAALAAAYIGLSAFQIETRTANSADAEALLVAGQYELAEVEARAAVEAQRVAHGDRALEVATASDLLVRVLVLNGRGAFEDTLALAQRAVDIKEARLGRDHLDLAPSLTNLADVLVALLQFERAITSAERAVAMDERRHSQDSPEVAVALDHLGRALVGAGRNDHALTVLERSLRIKDRTLPSSDVRIARTLEDITVILQQKGEYSRSGQAIRRAANLQQAANPHHPDYVRTLNLEAQQFWFDGLLLESRRFSEQAVELAERTLRPDHPTLALSLRYLAATLADLGDLNKSIALRERALAIAERSFGPQHHVTGEYLHALARAEFEQGAYAAARSGFQRVLAIFEARYGAWHEYVATTLSALARTDAKLGDYAKARREQSRAIAIYSRVRSPNHPFVAVALTELATVYREEGLLADALPLLERALAIREQRLGPQHRDVARTLADLASVVMLTGHASRAGVLASRALAIWERLDAPDAPEFATVLTLSAQIQTSRGDYAAATEQFRRALQIRSRVFGTSNPLYAEVQSGLSVAQAHRGEGWSALDAAVSAEATGRKHLQLMLRSLPERQALNYAAARPKGLSLILSLLDSVPEATSSALDELIRSRALVLDEVAARQGAGRGPIDSSDLTVAALTEAQQRLANLIVRGPGPLQPAQYAAIVDDARRESELAEQVMAERNVEFRTALSRAQTGLNEVSAALAADTALVSFVRYERTVFHTANGDARAPARAVPSYAAFVLRSGVPPAAISLGAVSAIDALVTEWRDGIAATGHLGSPPGGPRRASRVSGASLRRMVWDPIASRLGGATRVFIVPDGALSLVPFAALPIGPRSFLLETGPVIHYLSAERDVIPRTRAAAAERGLLAVGGPSFDSRPIGSSVTPSRTSASKTKTASLRGSELCGGLQGVRFQPLDGTLQEVQEVSRLWSASAVSSGEIDSAQLLVGRQASEATFKLEAQRYRVLHLATHGFFLDDSCAPTRTAGTRGVGGLTSKATVVQNPLRLSGLAFAGANRRAAPTASGDEDGILIAEEVAALNLQGVEWAVLSACDTGLGEIKAGEGVFGLRRAFQIAGARTVIMSLWSVDDQATRLWMRALYEGRLQKHLSTADAMHQASLSVLRARRAAGQSTHPFYWAGFVAAGDWR